MMYIKVMGEGLECPKYGYKGVVRCEWCDEIISRRQHVISDFLIGGHA